MENQKMSKFLVVYQDVNYDIFLTTKQVKALTKDHVDNIRKLDSMGILFLCGLLKGAEKAMC